MSLALPLTYCFEEQYSCADRDVERVEAAEHGYAYVGIGRDAPLLRKAGAFRSHNDGGAAAHICVVIKRRILQLGGQDADSALLEEIDGFL